MANELYQLWFYVPAADRERLKQALFAAGAGRIGDYSHCAWETPGTGQFLPLEGSNPTLGNQGQLERVEEYKVEMVLGAELCDVVINTLLEAHPYEEPAWGLVKLLNPGFLKP